MNDLFNAIVDMFSRVSRTIGLPYHELNILIYTFFIPATWWLIVWLRIRRLLGLALLHMAVPLFHYVETAKHSLRFYDANTAALLYLGGHTEAGYIKISLIAGVVCPILIWLTLLRIPQKWLIQTYFALLFVNMVWYAWALTRF